VPEPETPPQAPPAVEPAAPSQDSSVIREMRAKLDAALAEKKSAETQRDETAAKLKEKNDAELSETERLKQQVAELAPLRDSHGKYVGKLEALYAEELAAVPEEKRPAVEALSKSGDWGDRLDAIKAAKGLLTITAPAPQPMGAANSPGARAGAGATPPEAPKWDFSTAPRIGDLAFKS
jgi:hypothetical protein